MKKKEYDFHWKREYSLFYGAAVLQGSLDSYKRGLGFAVSIIGEGKDGWFSPYSEKGTLDKLNNLMKYSVEKDVNFLQKKIDEMKEFGQEFIEFTKNIKITEKISNKELQILYQKYYDLLRKYAIPLWESFYFIDICAVKFEEELKKELPFEKITDAIEFYSKPSQKAAPLLISEFFKKERDDKKKIRYLQNNFPWLGNNDSHVESFTNQHLLDYIKSFNLPKSKESKNNFNIKNKKIINIYQNMLYIKDKRDDYRREAFYYGLKLIKEIAKRLKITIKDLGLLLPSEIFDKDIKNRIKERKKGYIVEVNKDKINIIEGEEAINNFIKEYENKNIKSFNGTIGCSGIAKGKVHIIKTKDNLKDFRKNEILVAISTNANYVPAMQKASAFVTDEGGITCHAAIVAREMQKPCIIGTKISTKVLKDGDLVEVDANKGIVRKIK